MKKLVLFWVAVVAFLWLAFSVLASLAIERDKRMAEQEVLAYLECPWVSPNCEDEFARVVARGDRAVPILQRYLIEGPPTERIERERREWEEHAARWYEQDQELWEERKALDFGYLSKEEYVEANGAQGAGAVIELYKVRAAEALVAIKTPAAERAIYEALSTVNNQEAFWVLIKFIQQDWRFAAMRKAFIVRSPAELEMLGEDLLNPYRGWKYTQLPPNWWGFIDEPEWNDDYHPLLNADRGLGIFYDFRRDGSTTRYWVRFEHSPYDILFLEDKNSDGIVDEIAWVREWLFAPISWIEETITLIDSNRWDRPSEERPSYLLGLFHQADELIKLINDLEK